MTHIYTGDTIRIETKNTCLWMRVTEHGHIEHIYYGDKLPHDDPASLIKKRVIQNGSCVAYDEADDTYCLDTLLLEWSGTGRGDFRYAPCEIVTPDGCYINDFVFESAEVAEGCISAEALPGAYGGAQTLMLTMREKVCGVYLKLYYTVYPETDVITRRVSIINRTGGCVTVNRLMSMMMDIPDEGWDMTTFNGSWIKETHRQTSPVIYGRSVCESLTGSSSNRQNPGFLIGEHGAGEDAGRVYGFNLIYSGNHYSSAEKSPHDSVRIMTGINPHCFKWELSDGESFDTPEAVMSFSSHGYNGLSANFHDFINAHIVRGEWRDKERPVLINSWEAFFFDFNERKLLSLAKKAKDAGIELFVLDDGWFGARNDDRAGLGDYDVNKTKLPHGLKGLADGLKALGMSFGLWFEPESVNTDSRLYREHPEYAMTAPGRKPALGRHQLLLDLCREDVRDYIVSSVGSVLDSADISYVKWDMNRHMTDMYSAAVPQGELYHRYILGLYDVLARIFRPRPHILLETCSSGGNRFDLGMLCFSPQIWASDDTDPIERLDIQSGLSYMYPPSTMGAHVSQSPHQQTLRETPMDTRFGVAAFGCLGYELDLSELTPAEEKETAAQVKFYKEHRRTLQYGRFYRLRPRKDSQVCFESVARDGGEAVCLLAQKLTRAGETFDILPVAGLDKGARYTVRTRPKPLFIKRFGGLVKHILPVKLAPDGLILRTAGRHYTLDGCEEEYSASGATLMQGVRLNDQFMGTGYNETVRMTGDFGSDIYIITREEENDEKG